MVRDKEGEDVSSSSVPSTADKRQGQLSHTYVLGADSPATPMSRTNSTVLPGEVQKLLSKGLQLVKGKDSSPALMTPGPGLPLAVSGKE